MAMLAEKKRKQRWSLNPRGSAWAEDSNKFGQKMLEKMGWKHGKGLGTNEDGIKEHLKISYKNDSKGMGFKEVEGWTEHEENFSALLNNLCKTSDVDPSDYQIKSVSLEEVSQKSRVRVHYHKFTKGKDLSRYSEKDLASIFGKKSLVPPHKDEVDIEKNEKFVKKGCMVDYFKKKLPNFSLNGNGYTIGSNGVLQKESEACENERCGFGYEETTISCSQEITENEAGDIHGKESHKRKLGETELKCDLNEGDETADEVTKSEKKRRRKSKNETNEEVVEEKCESKSHKEKLKEAEGTFVSYLPKKDDVSKNNEENSKEPEVTSLEKKKRRKSNLKVQVNEEEQSSTMAEAKERDGGKRSKKNRKTKLKEAEAAKPSFVSYLNNENSLENDEKSGKKKSHDVKQGEANYDEHSSIENTPKMKSPKKKFRAEETKLPENIIAKTDEEPENISEKEPKLSKRKKASKKKKNEDKCEIKPSPRTDEKPGKKQKRNADDPDRGISNPAFDPLYNNIVVEKHVLDAIVENEESFADTVENETPSAQKQKKKNRPAPEEEKASKKKKNGDGCEPSPRIDEKRGKKQKRNAYDPDQGISNPAFDPLYNNIVVEKHVLDTIVENEETFADMVENETLSAQKQKKKKNRPAPEEEKASKKKKNVDDCEPSPRIDEKPGKKQRRNAHDPDQGISNPAFDPLYNNIVFEKHVLDTIENEETFADALENETTPIAQKQKKKKNRPAPANESLNKIEEIEAENAAGFDNPTFRRCNEENSSTADARDNPYEVKAKEKKQKKRKIDERNDGIDNPIFSEGAANKEHEIKIKSKKRKLDDEANQKANDGKREEKKHMKDKRGSDALALDNPGFKLEGGESEERNEKAEKPIQIDEELLLNVASLPVDDAAGGYETKRFPKYKRSVTFNNVVRNGIYNAGYDRRANHIEENVAYMSRTFDRFHAEVENDINEAKYRRGFNSPNAFIGEPDGPSDNHVQLSEGTRLSFKNVRFSKPPIWARNQTGVTGPKKSYKHLIKGDIIVKFMNTNLHQISGYATTPYRR